MGEYKPLGSEKLSGDDKLKRILELTYFNTNKKNNNTKADLVKESKNGGVYGIVKEKDGYYVKSGLNESSLDYIGGMFMKNKNKFSSYSEALKRLEYIKGQDEIQLQEATKYVLKQNKPQTEAPAAAPTLDTPPPPPPAPAADAAAPAPSADVAPAPTGDSAGTDASATDAEGKPSSYMSEIQKFAGKLGQELRDQHERLESDDIKYVLNMIISAVDLKKLEDEDIEEIAKRFEREEKERGLDGGDDFGSDEPSSEMPSEEPAPTEMNENDPMASLDEFINSPAPTDEIDLSKYAMKEEEPLFTDDSIASEMSTDETKELDLDEIKNAIGETLSKYFN